MADFDPSGHDVDAVLAYLDGDGVDFEEIARVVAAEREGENREAIVTWLPPSNDVVDELSVDERPVWDVRTHGNPPYGRENSFRVVGRD